MQTQLLPSVLNEASEPQLQVLSPLNTAPGALQTHSSLDPRVASLPQSGDGFAQTPFLLIRPSWHSHEYLSFFPFVQSELVGAVHWQDFPSVLKEAPGPQVQDFSALMVAPGARHSHVPDPLSKAPLPQVGASPQTPFISVLPEGQLHEYLSFFPFIQLEPVGVEHSHCLPSSLSLAPGPHVQDLSELKVAPGALQVQTSASPLVASLPQSVINSQTPFLFPFPGGHTHEYELALPLIQLEPDGVEHSHSLPSSLSLASGPHVQDLSLVTKVAPGASHWHEPLRVGVALEPHSGGLVPPQIPLLRGLSDGHEQT